MSKQNLQAWLKRRDPIHRGWTRAGIADALCSTNGFFFPRIRGGYNLYRDTGRVPDVSSELVGAAGADARNVQTFPWVTHEADTIYQYRLVPVGGGGVENWGDQTVASVAFSESGAWYGLSPNAPTDLRVTAALGGRFLIRWTYSPQGQQAEPAGFHLYRGIGSVVNYGSVSGNAPYSPGQLHYEFLSGPRPHGQRVVWAVRAYSAAGLTEKNTETAFAFACSQPPPADPVVAISVE